MEAKLIAALSSLVTVTNVLAAFAAGLFVDIHKAAARKTKPGRGVLRWLARLPESGFGKRTIRLAPIFWCVLFLLIPGLTPKDPVTKKTVEIGVTLGMGVFWGALASWVYGTVMGLAKKRSEEELKSAPRPTPGPPPPESER